MTDVRSSTPASMNRPLSFAGRQDKKFMANSYHEPYLLQADSLDPSKLDRQSGMTLPAHLFFSCLQ